MKNEDYYVQTSSLCQNNIMVTTFEVKKGIPISFQAK